MKSSVWEEIRTPTLLTPLQSPRPSEEIRTPTLLTPLQSPKLSEKEPITPIKNAALSPKQLSRVSSRTQHSRQSSMHDAYEKAKARKVALHRKYWVRVLFEYTIYVLLLLFVYFVLIGMPLWKGAVWWLYWVVAHKFVISGGYAITLGLAAL
jgi:hypothetical protein